jgi:catechol 2,3-dioxygenase-like lactoylglutathione lyase family enzyme
MPQPTQSIQDLIVRQHHTAVSCADWDTVKSFFVDLLGFKVLGEMENRNEPELATVTGLPGAACRWAMLELSGYHIELFKWLTPEGKPVPIRQCDHGLTHICFQVKDAAEARRHDRRRLSAAVRGDVPAGRPRQALLLPRPRRLDRRVRRVPVRA